MLVEMEEFKLWGKLGFTIFPSSVSKQFKQSKKWQKFGLFFWPFFLLLMVVYSVAAFAEPVKIVLPAQPLTL